MKEFTPKNVIEIITKHYCSPNFDFAWALTPYSTEALRIYYSVYYSVRRTLKNGL